MLVTPGHTRRSGAHPFVFVCSDSGRGKDDSGMAGLTLVVDEASIPGATGDAARARLGDGTSTYRDGIISAVNVPTATCWVEVGMKAKDADRLLADRPRNGVYKHPESVCMT